MMVNTWSAGQGLDSVENRTTFRPDTCAFNIVVKVQITCYAVLRSHCSG